MKNRADAFRWLFELRVVVAWWRDLVELARAYPGGEERL